MIYTEKLQSRIDDYDIEGYMMPGGLFKALENLSDHHAVKVFESNGEESVKGITWVLSEWRVKIYRSPMYKEEAQGVTWVNTTTNSARMVRNFRILSPEGEVLVDAEAKVAMFDIFNHKLVRVDDKMKKIFDLEEKDLFPKALSKKPVMPEEVEKRVPIALRRADGDYNLHVHNTVYWDIALEVLEERFLYSKEIDTIHVIYRYPIHLEQKVEAAAAPVTEYELGNLHKVGIYADGQLSSVVEIYEKRP